MKKIKISAIVVFSLCGLFITLGFLAFFSALWFMRSFNSDVGLDSVLFTLFSEMHGVDGGMVSSFIWEGALPTLLCSAFLTTALILIPKLIAHKQGLSKLSDRIHKTIALGVALCLFFLLIGVSASHIGLPEYIAARMDNTSLYENYYVNPDKTDITFPEEKRNLIYIYLESVETTFMDEENGGAAPFNLIPELTELAKNNINFSQSTGIGGGQTTVGSTWTIGAMVTHSSGVPLSLPEDIWINGLNYYSQVLPGLTTITNILHDNGYRQALMVGSDASFGGRKEFFSQHGMNNVYDLYTARQEFLPSADYNDNFWGFEDYYLFDYAKIKINDLAENDAPFAFTMLTVDTHHPQGHPCPKCELRDTSEAEDSTQAMCMQFEDVISCSSRQVAEFVEWIQGQDFYENTTVIITGDHYSMNTDYFNTVIPEEYTRRVYNCFINTPISPVKEKEREFTTLDMFPTTLAALGCTIEGNRLGLGVNLFSEESTLSETLGFDYLTDELTKISPYYEKNFHYGTRTKKD